MHIVSLQLRNYRVFPELDLEIPAGVVGVFGANGAGKSTLLESILWGLYGKARTQKGDIRSTGATGECSVELCFAHEGHYYRVRRTISGQNSTVKARLWVGEQVAADGPTEVDRFMHSLLGMDHSAFRASVFAEQKQLAAFSDQAPDRRRQLVLQLLGITPLEKARDAARSDAKQRQAEHQRVLAVLPELARLEDRLAQATTQADQTRLAVEQLAANQQRTSLALQEAVAKLAGMEEARNRHQLVRQQGAAARQQRDRAATEVERLTAEVVSLQQDRAQLAPLETLAQQAEQLDLIHTALRAYDAAQQQLAALPTPQVTQPPDPADVATQREAVEQVSTAHAVLRSQLQQAQVAVAAARKAADHTRTLDGDAACPLCGQELGTGFITVKEHRAAELQQALAEQQLIAAKLPAAENHVTAQRGALQALETQVQSAATSAAKAAKVIAQQQAAQAALDAGAQQLNVLLSNAPGELPSSSERTELGQRRTLARDAAVSAARLRGRLEAEPSVHQRLSEEQHALAEAEALRQSLLAEVRTIAFVPAVHDEATQRHAQAAAAAQTAQHAAQQASIAAAGGEASRAALALQLDEARDLHSQVAELAVEARHLARTADLLQGFRHLLVGLIGPRLSIQASDLFNELTGNDYDGLEVDPETYELRILDRGTAYPTNRFSGSEVDLANLALRVAISEQVRFQAGGQVGLLVLDEALASLDADRKDRMLTALTRLGGRFRQILVVTHAPEVKEQLPQAIEVVRTGARRSTARVVEATG